MAVNLIPLMTDFHQKVIYTEANLQLKATSLFKYVWTFTGHRALKSYELQKS